MKLQCTEEKLEKAIRLYGLAGVHEALKWFPMMSEPDYTRLCDSIKRHGYAEPVVITPDGYILDGRARLCASIEEHITLDAPVERLDPVDPVQYIASVNLFRQHLTPRQIKQVEKEAKKHKAEERQKRELWKGLSENE